MKKSLLMILLVLISVSALGVSAVRGDSDNTFVGMDTASELDDLDYILQDANGPKFEDGEITAEELDFSRIQKIHINTLTYFFKDQETDAGSIKEMLDDADYVYYMPLYREHQTIFLTIAIGRELSPEGEAILTEEGKAYIRERAGKWIVSEVGISEEPLDPATDYMGLMESYLELKDIHNAEIYFVSRINPESMINAVCLTGKKTESGEDEMIFVAVDKLEYDESGVLDYSDAEYTYEELRKMNEEDDWGPEYSGGGGGTGKRDISWIYIPIAVVVIAIAGTVFTSVRRKMRR